MIILCRCPMVLDADRNSILQYVRSCRENDYEYGVMIIVGEALLSAVEN